MDDEQLVNLVYVNDLIYNKNNKDHKNAEKKRRVWAEIAIQMGATVEQCMRRWTTLRDHFSRECRRVNAGTANQELQWPLFTTMQFLKPYIIPRPDRYSSNTWVDVRSQSPSSASAESSTSPVSETECSLKCPLSEVPLLEQPIMSQQLPSPLPSPPKKKIKTTEDETDKAFIEAMEAFKRECKAREDVRQNKQIGYGAVRGFGQMVMALIEELSLKKQIKTMNRVTEVVMVAKSEPDDDE